MRTALRQAHLKHSKCRNRYSLQGPKNDKFIFPSPQLTLRKYTPNKITIDPRNNLANQQINKFHAAEPFLKISACQEIRSFF